MDARLAGLALFATLTAAPAKAAVTYLFYGNLDNRFVISTANHIPAGTSVSGGRFTSCFFAGLPCTRVSFDDWLDVGTRLTFHYPDGEDPVPLHFEGIRLDSPGFAFDTRGIAILEISGIPDEPPPLPTVPEPASWALFVAGWGLAGAALRQRRRCRNAPPKACRL